MKSIGLPSIFIFLCLHFHAQLETSKWYFGNGCGVDFAQTPPVAITSTVFNSYEGGASISDATGNLLFYTDANTVWNQNHQIMANGAGILGGQSSTQSSLIIQQPGSTNLFYLFTQESQGQPNGFRYSIVDMNLSAGQGSVTAKNILIYTPSCEKLTAVKHCNGVDFWILTYNNAAQNFKNFLFTTTGLNTVPVISNIGTVPIGVNTLGQLRVSPNGRRLASAAFNAARVELFDFDPSNGSVSNAMILTHTLMQTPYGVEFSPDGTKLYASTYGTRKIIQWDLCAGNLASILASAYILDASASFGTSSLQLGPNGKIYINHNAGNKLSVINNPNGAQANCAFSFSSQPCGGSTTLGLPNFMCSWFKNLGAQFTYTQNCSTVTFSNPYQSSACAGAITYTSQNWNFGDPNAGSQNSSSLAVINHAYNAAGTYTVKLLLHSICGTDSILQTIVIPATSISINGVDSICLGSTATLTGNATGSFSWSTGQVSNTILISPTVTTNYSIFPTSTLSCGSISAQHLVKVFFPSQLNMFGIDSICKGDSTNLGVTGANSYSWSTGQTSNSVNVAPIQSNNYFVVCSFTNGCISQVKNFTITVLPNPTLAVNVNSFICAGEIFTITASGAVSYSWNSGGSGSIQTLTANQNTSVSIIGYDANGCKSDSSFYIIVNECTSLNEYTKSAHTLRIFPNPVNNELTVVTANKLKIEILNVLGELMEEKLLEPGTHFISTVQFANGLYLIRSTNETFIQTAILIKQ